MLAFEDKKSLFELALELNKDISVISRRLKSIANSSNLLEKSSNNKWQLTPQGFALNKWTREAIYNQQLNLKQTTNIKIATTREFASRVLLPQTRTLIGNNNISVSILSTDTGIENLILESKADFGFDCGRPNNPSIGYKKVIEEDLVIIASPDFVKKYKIKNFSSLIREQNKNQLKFSRLNSQIWDLDVDDGHYFGTFSDLANLREAALLGYGWAIVPYYAVKKETENNKLKIIPGKNLPPENYSVWWLRERTAIKPWVEKAIEWLANQKLQLQNS